MGETGVAWVQEVHQTLVTFQIVVSGLTRVHKRIKWEHLEQILAAGCLREGTAHSALMLLSGKVGLFLTFGGISFLFKAVKAERLSALELGCVDVQITVGRGVVCSCADDCVHVSKSEENTGNKLLI